MNAITLWKPQPNNAYCMDANLLLQHLDDESVDMQFFDPPYGKGYKAGEKRTNGRKVKRVFSAETFTDVADTSFLPDAYRVLKTGAACYLCTQWDVMHIWLEAMRAAGYNVPMSIIWDKANMGQGDIRYYGCQTEMILFGVKGKHELNWHKRESNIWYVPRIDVINIDGNYDNPTQKPTTLVKMALQRSSKPNDLILDVHCGTGTTAVAARQLNRRYIVCDNKPGQVAITEGRLAAPVTMRMFA